MPICLTQLLIGYHRVRVLSSLRSSTQGQVVYSQNPYFVRSLGSPVPIPFPGNSLFVSNTPSFPSYPFQPPSPQLPNRISSSVPFLVSPHFPRPHTILCIRTSRDQVQHHQTILRNVANTGIKSNQKSKVQGGVEITNPYKDGHAVVIFVFNSP